ncbi:MAG: AAC(3) family N-acetyltransferase [Sphingobacteriaceae bacterium]|nr:AAC(3) family N-acetyltransferase [Sphingobacteriaceae bacterium]
MRRILKKILPPFLLKQAKKIVRNQRSLKRQKLVQSGDILNLMAIEKSLLAFGLQKGDVVMVHSSLSQLGYVEGGAQTLIQAFLNVIGEKGTLVMPSFPGLGFNADYLKTNPIFDLQKTPSSVGIISETFRKMPDVVRSLHPTEPVCASGPLAKEITNEHFGHISPYLINSPFGKLVKFKAKIIMLGVNLDTLSSLHLLEDAVDDFKYPIYLKEIFTCKLIDGQGNLCEMKTKVHNPEWSKKRKCNELEQMFIRDGCLVKYKLGHAEVLLLDAEKMFDSMLTNYKNKGITMYTPKGE